MLGDTIKVLRKNKNMTQEELASRIHVVRQTVSKWEKGQSVPDADSLQALAEVLEVSVSDLLGSTPAPVEQTNEIAEQLSRINEQLVIRNRRWHRFWKTLGLILAAIILLWVLLAWIFGANYHNVKHEQEESYSQELSEEEITSTAVFNASTIMPSSMLGTLSSDDVCSGR